MAIKVNFCPPFFPSFFSSSKLAYELLFIWRGGKLIITNVFYITQFGNLRIRLFISHEQLNVSFLNFIKKAIRLKVDANQTDVNIWLQTRCLFPLPIAVYVRSWCFIHGQALLYSVKLEKGNVIKHARKEFHFVSKCVIQTIYKGNCPDNKRQNRLYMKALNIYIYFRTTSLQSLQLFATRLHFYEDLLHVIKPPSGQPHLVFTLFATRPNLHISILMKTCSTSSKHLIFDLSLILFKNIFFSILSSLIPCKWFIL